MNWLSDFVRPKIKKITTKEIADNLWTKCPQCGQMLFTKELEKNNFIFSLFFRLISLLSYFIGKCNQ